MCKTPHCVANKVYCRGFCKACYNTRVQYDKEQDLTGCECGCGVLVPGRFLPGHDNLVRRKIRDGHTNRQRYHQKLRMAAFAAYGGRCACCGLDEWEFLVIDHVDGGGRIHRLEIGGGVEKRGVGAGMYLWLKRSGYPSGFQVLCANCNMAKERAGGCPHAW